VQIRSTLMRQGLAGRSIALLFLNPSLRTHATNEIGANRQGAHALYVRSACRSSQPTEGLVRLIGQRFALAARIRRGHA
jgi:ornithine carbamoyltransferase